MTEIAEPMTIPAETPAEDELLHRIINALRTVYDPEIPVNIYELGLIYGIEISPERDVRIRMTLTSPTCPEAEVLPGRARDRVLAVPSVMDCRVDLVWDPTWNMGMMSEAAKLQLNLD
jgi:FeS assembly SUF system protein